MASHAGPVRPWDASSAVSAECMLLLPPPHTHRPAGLCHQALLSHSQGMLWNFLFLTGNPERMSPQPVTTMTISWNLQPGRQKNGVPAPSPRRGTEIRCVMCPYGMGVW